MRGKRMHLYAYNLESRWVDEGANHTELTYKQFMNGTVPKKKEFKVGDWVESIGEYRVGDAAEIIAHDIYSEHEYQVRFQDGDRTWKRKRNLKHTTKPKEQPIQFCGHDVKLVYTGDERDIAMGQSNMYYEIGCKKIKAEDLNGFISVCESLQGHATPNEAEAFINENKQKLGL